MDAKIFPSIIAVMNDIEAIEKNKTNANQGYKFRGIDDMYNAIHPLFARHKIFITSKVISSSREERKSNNGGVIFSTLMDVEFTFFAEDGSSVSSVMRGEAMDSGDKGSNKAQSAALKYALIQMFLIPTEDLEDADKNTPPDVKPKDEVKIPEVIPPKKEVEMPEDIKNKLREYNKQMTVAKAKKLLEVYGNNFDSIRVAGEFHLWNADTMIEAQEVK